MVFGDNDRPGVMGADAARIYVGRYGVDACLHWLLNAPEIREEGSDYIGGWAQEIAYDPEIEAAG